jgi:hypothetical protein
MKVAGSMKMTGLMKAMNDENDEGGGNYAH